MLRTLAAAKTQGVQVVTPRVGEPFEGGVLFVNQSWFQPPQRP